ncbi:transcriptional protein SWT1 [Microplitis mediator]|uniref:transcriptional protein SWT1 n=1 Tax=Microplitis mediator TaxID=375433 RepID=UPI0025532AB1|nr:transcriptional protein SWT1 [Microplitis mediator]
MAKNNLPKDWILVTSTTDPTRNYFFNTATNKSTWEFPDGSDNLSAQSPRKNVSKKRKKTMTEDNDKVRYRPFTPEPDVERRPKLVAKRKLSTARGSEGKKKNNDKQESSSDTPQMKALREKMLQRQAAKGSGIKKPRALKSSTLKSSPGEKKDDKVDKVDKSPVKASKASAFNDNDKDNNKSKDEDEAEKVMTPQMKILKQKMLARRSLPAAADKKSKSVAKINSKKSQSTRLSAIRNKSMSDSTVTSSTSMSTSVIASTSASPSTSPPGDSKSSKPGNVCSPRTRASRSISSFPTSPRKRPSKTIIETKLKQLKTLEAPPGVSAKRILVTDSEDPDRKNEAHFLIKSISPPSTSGCINNNIKIPRIQRVKSDTSSTTDSEDSPTVYKNAEDRMKALCSSLKTQRACDKRLFSLPSDDSTDKRFNNSTVLKSFSHEEFYEEMDWEPSEEEKIVFEIQNVRSQLPTGDDVQMIEMTKNGLDLTDNVTLRETSDSLRKLYIVVDTNVFLSNLQAIEEARDAVFKFYHRPIIIVPWTVIRELDFIKDDKSNSRPASLKTKARQAIQFLNNHFAEKHPRILGQTFADVLANRQKFELECPDDEILQTCLQIKTAGHHVVLLTYDKNLCNKAMINNVIFIGKNDPLEKIDYLKESEIKERLSLTDSLKDSGELDNGRESRAEFLIAEEMLQDVNTALTSFLSVIVTKELKNLFGDNWERHAILRPPWTIITVLRCATKHWIAAVSESFSRQGEFIIKDLLQAISGLRYRCQLKDVEQVIKLFYDLVGCLKAEKYPNIIGNVTGTIEELKQKYRDSVKLIYRNNNEVNCDNDPRREEEHEAKAALAFSYFENVYAHARDLCGTAAQIMGMMCTFPYKKIDSPSIVDDIKKMRPEVAGNLNRLLQILSTALDEIDELDINHSSVRALHQVLTTFTPEAFGNQKLSPLDVYCCLKRREKSLRLGLGQLQELSSHFCRMATFKSS